MVIIIPFLHLPKFLNYEKQNKNKNILISIKWQESFKGILGAHFWLKNEYDSYLGDIRKGGGAQYTSILMGYIWQYTF